MTTEDIIIHIFYLVDENLKAVKRVPQTHLYPGEIVTIGILFALKGGHFRASYRWLNRDFAPCLPDCRIEPICNACLKRISSIVISGRRRPVC